MATRTVRAVPAPDATLYTTAAPHGWAPMMLLFLVVGAILALPLLVWPQAFGDNEKVYDRWAKCTFIIAAMGTSGLRRVTFDSSASNWVLTVSIVVVVLAIVRVTLEQYPWLQFWNRPRPAGRIPHPQTATSPLALTLSAGHAGQRLADGTLISDTACLCDFRCPHEEHRFTHHHPAGSVSYRCPGVPAPTRSPKGP